MTDSAELCRAQAIPARDRIAALAAAIPQLKAEAEVLQREIIGLAPSCEAGNEAARDRRKKLRAQLSDLNEAVADKEAAIAALQPEAVAEQDNTSAAALTARAASAEMAFLARDSAAKRADEALSRLIDDIHECDLLGAEAIRLCHGLLSENRIGWVMPPRVGTIIVQALVSAGILSREFLPGGCDVGRESIAKLMNADSAALVGTVREAAAAAAMPAERRRAAEKQRLEAEAANLARIDREREASGARY